MHGQLKNKIKNNSATVGVIGLGYVGLPLTIEFVRNGFPVIGFDTDPGKVRALKSGQTYIKHIPDRIIKEANDTGLFTATTEAQKVREMDAILICVPTPLTPQREPDMTYVIKSCEMISEHVRSGQLICLESTTYPGTTDEVMRPILERGGLVANKDFILAYSPEREDPNNEDFTTSTIPKVVGCDDPVGLDVALSLYSRIVKKPVAVSSTRAAEATKLVENIYRSVNIALVNELKMLFTEMNIDVWEVIDAAATKPFGFTPFYPGPGLGGHCIPVDPFYLTWKAREYDMPTKFVELAGEINTHMPRYVVNRISNALNDHGKALKGTKLLILGMAYKRNVDDMRESPSLKLMELLEERGVEVDFHDPYIPVIPETREHGKLAGRKGVSFDELETYDCVLVATDHSDIPYEELVRRAQLIVDTRNVTRRYDSGKKVVSA